MQTLTHAFPATFRVRHEDDAGGDGRTLVGLAVPYDVELEVDEWWDVGYTEVFRKGSFAKTIRDRSKPVPLLVSHAHRSLGIGRSVRLEETDAGLEADFHLTEGVQQADEVLALVADEAISGLSIGFEPVQDRTTRGPNRTPANVRDLVERTEVVLREVSVCNFPAYSSAGVTGIRSVPAPGPEAIGRHPSIAALVADRGRLVEARTSALDRWGRVVRR